MGPSVVAIRSLGIRAVRSSGKALLVWTRVDGSIVLESRVSFVSRLGLVVRRRGNVVRGMVGQAAAVEGDHLTL